MKHAIVTLIIVILFVLVVVPLIYIALGKLKNPIDMFALSKVGKSGMATQQSNFISQNYIPASGGGSFEKKPETSSYDKVLEDAKNCFSDAQLLLISDEYLSLEKKEGSKLNLRNDQTGTSRYFDGVYPTVITRKAFLKAWNTMETKTVTFTPGCAKNGSSPESLIAAYADGGIYESNSLKQDPSYMEGYDLTGKGVTTINGLTYYWTMSEGKNRIYKDPRDKNSIYYYIATYFTLYNNKVYLTIYDGKSDMFGSSRDFQNHVQTFLGGTVYGTSTPGNLPYLPTGTQGQAGGAGSTTTPAGSESGVSQVSR